MNDVGHVQIRLGHKVWHTRLFLVFFYLLAVMWGIRSLYPTEPSALDLVLPLAISLSLAWWAVVDARLRRHPIPLSARGWFFLLGLVLIPGYVVWSRRWHGVGWVILNAVLWYLVATIALHAAGLAIYGDQWLRALGL